MRRLVSAGLVAGVIVLTGGVAAGSDWSAHEPIRVGLAIDISARPGSRDLGGLIYRGFLTAVHKFRVQGRVVKFSTDPMAALAALGRARFDLIIPAFISPSDVDAAALTYPHSRFLLLDVPHESLLHRPRNVEDYLFRSEQASYLAGYLSALMERRRPGKDAIGSVGGVKIPGVDSYIAGYQAGARKADPGIITLNTYTGDFVNQAKCRSAALNEIAAGAGVVFNVAGFCGLGALEAAKQHGVWGIGVDIDQSYLGPAILTSVLKREDLAVISAVRTLTKGRFSSGGDVYFDLRSGVVGLGRVSARTPRAFLSRINRVRAQIVAGKIHVPSTLK